MTISDQANDQPNRIPLRSWFLKFIPLALMQLFAIFSYNCLRTLKDTVIIRSTGDASTFGWLKILVILPLSFALTMFIERTRTRLGENKNKLNYFLLGLFITYYLSFIFIFLPAENFIHLPNLVQKLMSLGFIPKGLCEGLGNILGYWSFSGFYGMSEIFGAIGIQIVCWGTASAILETEERTRFFPVFAYISQTGAFFASEMMTRVSISRLENDEFTLKLKQILALVIGLLFMICAVYYFIEKTTINTEEFKLKTVKSKSKSTPLTMKETFGVLLSNPYLRKMAGIVFSYNICINLVEISWKDAIISSYGAAGYSSIYSATLALNSIATIAMATLSTFVLSRFSLVVRAMLPIMMMGFTGLLFLFFFIFSDSTQALELMSYVGLGMYAPIQLSVIIGCIQNIGSKSAKYSLFDSTKEELFAAGDTNERERGKAAIDVTVARIGKSSSGFIQSFLIVFVPIASMMISSIFDLRRTPSLTRPVATEEQRRHAAKKVLECLGQLETKFDEEKNEFSVSIPAAEGVEFARSEDGFRIFTSAEAPKAASIQAPKKKTNQRMIAPFLLFFVMFFVSVWSYSVISIYPEYRVRVRKQQIDEERARMIAQLQNGNADGEYEISDEDVIKRIAPEAAVSTITLREVGYLVLLSITICGTLFFLTSRKINAVIKSNSEYDATKKASMIKTSNKANMMDKSTITDAGEA